MFNTMITGKRESSRVLTLELIKERESKHWEGVALESLCLTH